MTDLLLRAAVLAAAIFQIVFPIFVNPFRDGQNSLRISDPSQIEPAGYAFSIWGPIYLAALAYAVWQLAGPGRTMPSTLRIAPLAVLLYLGSSVWLAAAKFGPLWATIPILAAMAVSACTILIVATSSAERSTGWWWFVILPFGIYAGWTTAATFVNVATVAPGYGFDRFGLSIPGYAMASLAAATVVTALILWLTRGNAVYAATIAWALVAIIVAGRARGAAPEVLLTAGGALGVVVVLTLALSVWGRSGSSQPSTVVSSTRSTPR